MDEGILIKVLQNHRDIYHHADLLERLIFGMLGVTYSDSANEGEIWGKLRMACAEAFRSYAEIRDQESLLT